MTSHLPLDTWRRKGDLFSWDIQLPRGSSGLQAELRHATRVVLTTLSGFAAPNEVSFSTVSEGEDAAVLDGLEEISASAVDAVFDTHHDVEEVCVGLDLLVTGPDGPARIDEAGSLWLQLEDEPDDRDSPLRLLFSLDVDIYAERTHGNDPDNTVLAALNGPRLTRFLKRVRDELGGIVMDIDAPSYADQVTPTGFRRTGS